MTPAVDRDRDHDDHADQDLLHVARPAHLLAAVPEEGHHERPHHRAHDRALAAAQAAAPDHHGGDHVELGAGGHGRVALAKPRHLHHAREAEEQAGHAVDRELEPRGIDAAGARGGLARAEREDAAAEDGAPQHEGHRRGEQECYPDAGREHHPGNRREGDGQLVDPGLGRVDRGLAGQPLRGAARNPEHAQGGDERHHPQARDGEAAREADDTPRDDRGQHGEDRRQQAMFPISSFGTMVHPIHLVVPLRLVLLSILLPLYRAVQLLLALLHRLLPTEVQVISG